MAKRPGQTGRWVLPVVGVFLSLTIVWGILTVLGRMVPITGEFFGGLTLVVGILALILFAATLAGIAWLLLAMFQRQLRADNSDDAAPLEQALKRQTEMLQAVREAVLVSDRAKAVAYREQERDALRLAIQEDIKKEDWEAAYHLIDEMQAAFGYHEEAERLRAEIDQHRGIAIKASMQTELARFRQALNTQNWEVARSEAEKLMANFPEAEETQNLAQQIQESWEHHKRHLLNEFRQLIDRSQLDRAIEILKELDQYLTPGEAEGLQEAARGVFRAKLHNLGVQFSLAVSERNWDEAIAAGQEIIDEFPNSRMAREVRENIEHLRQRAAETA
jgi:hypothetical protein